MERLLGLKNKEKIAWHNGAKTLKRGDRPQGYTSTDNVKLDAIYYLAIENAVFGNLDHFVAYKPGLLRLRHATQKK